MDIIPNFNISEVQHVPDVSLVDTHSETDGGNNDRDFPLRPFLLHSCAVLSIQTFEKKMNM